MKKEFFVALAWAGGMVLLALGARFALNQGYIDYDTMLRILAMDGLTIGYYGNRLLKAAAPNVAARQVARFAGWSFVLSGLVYAGLWAFAPVPLAMTIGNGVVAAGVIVTLGYCFWVVARERADA